MAVSELQGESGYGRGTVGEVLMFTWSSHINSTVTTLRLCGSIIDTWPQLDDDKGGVLMCTSYIQSHLLVVTR